MDRLTQHLVLVLVGGITLRVAVTDAHLAYVQPGFRPVLVLAAAVLLALGLVGVAGELPRLRNRPADDSADAGQGAGGHGHGHRAPGVAWLLVLPVAVLLLVAPPALGSFTAQRQAQAVAPPAARQALGLGADDPGTDHRTLTLHNYAIRALAADPRALQGRLVRLTGFVTLRPDGGWYISRIAINCCAADAVAITVVVDGPRGDLAPDQWIEVIGGYAPPRPHPSAGYPEAVISPRTITPIDPPANTYQ